MTMSSAVSKPSITKRRRTFLLGLAVLAAMLVLPASAFAFTYTWTGTSSSAWNTSGNWTSSDGGVTFPGSGDTATIPTSTPNHPICTTAAPCEADTITVNTPGKLEVTTGTLKFTTLNLDNSSDLVLTSASVPGTIGPESSGGTATITGTQSVVIPNPAGSSGSANPGVNYNFNTGDTLALGTRVELDQYQDAEMQGTLAVNSQAYDLIGPGSSTGSASAGKGVTLGVTAGTPVVTIGNAGLLDNEGTGASVTNTVDPRVNMTSTGAQIADHSTASPEQLVFANNATATGSPSTYQGTINETGSSSFSAIVLGNCFAVSACSSIGIGPAHLGAADNSSDWGGQLNGALTVDNASHDRNRPDSQVEIFTSNLKGTTGSPTAAFNLNNTGNTITMNGDLTLDSTTANTTSPTGGFFSGTATFQSGGTVGDLLIHDAQFAGSPSGQTITIPHGTTSVVEKDNATWNNKFNFNVSGTLLIDSQQISTTALPANAPTINIGSSAVLSHTGPNVDPTVQPIVNSSGLIEDSGAGLSFANPQSTTGAPQTDTLSGTLQTQGTSTDNAIWLGDTGNNFPMNFQLTGPLTADNFTHSGSPADTVIGTIGTAGDSDNNVELNGNTLTIAGNGATFPSTTLNEFSHKHGTISGNGTINGPGNLLLGGRDLTPGAMTINAPIDQASGGSSDTSINGSGGALTVNSVWSVDDNDIGYGPTSTTPTTVTISSTGSLVHVPGSGNVGVDVPLTVNGTLTNNGSGTWTIDSSDGDATVPGPGEDCGATLDCATTIGSGATVNANSGTTRFANLTNTGAWAAGEPTSGDLPTSNTLTGGTWTVSGILQLPTAGTTAPNIGVEHLDASLSISGAGKVQSYQENNSGATGPGLAYLQSVDSTGTLLLTNASAFNGDSTSQDFTALTTIDGTVQLDGSSILSNGHGPASGTTIDATGVVKGNLGTFNAFVGPLFNNGLVQPGDTAGVPGTLYITSPANQTSYSQGTSGKLNIVINGVGSGQYGLLDIKDGNVDLDGTLNLQPTSTYQSAAAVNDDIPFLVSEQISAVHQFANVIVSPALSGGKTFSIDYSEPNETEAVVQQCTSGNCTVGNKPGATTPPVPPAVSGTPKVGQTLSTTNGNWSNNPTSFSYQWYDCSTSGFPCTAISGANSSSYTLTSSDKNSTIRVTVTATNTAGSGAQVSSPVGPVTGPTKPLTPTGLSLNKSSVKHGKTVKLTLTLSQGGTITVQIKNKHGKVKKTLTFTKGAGTQTLKIKTKGLKKGKYTLVVTETNANGTSGKAKIKLTLT